jgi:hypothetical protein
METFVVRIWVPSDADRGVAGEVVRGFVEHARTGATTRFAGADELLAALACSPPPGDAHGVADDGNAVGSTPTSVIRST